MTTKGSHTAHEPNPINFCNSLSLPNANSSYWACEVGGIGGYGRVMKAHFILRTDLQKHAVTECMQSLPADPVHEVIIREYKSKRSNPQNDAFHGICADAAQYIGCSTEEAKRMIKADLLGTVIVEKEGFKFEVLRSTAQLNVEEMSGLIEQATAWCIEREIPLRQFAWEYC